MVNSNSVARGLEKGKRVELVDVGEGKTRSKFSSRGGIWSRSQSRKKGASQGTQEKGTVFKDSINENDRQRRKKLPQDKKEESVTERETALIKNSSLPGGISAGKIGGPNLSEERGARKLVGKKNGGGLIERFLGERTK